MKIDTVVFDVDGVFTTGQFLYTKAGKFAKIFGPHDNDGIKLLKPLLQIKAISADKRGWSITHKRIAQDMDLPLFHVPESERLSWFKHNTSPRHTIYMADGYHDLDIFKIIAYSIAPASALSLVRAAADFVTPSPAGQGAVFEACWHLRSKFFSKG